uniref:CBM20 domain-containing protein n=1 Tax=Chromera velia CCMP2878 TaxID=1169474 RepID=A0A0G4I1T9_9ALVE|eukprot:Cvel_10206.t1-p1 / transcript=Cvel_10206.t1 / gene=Cvel_10206 / organism=Chromera_velia_CCMP2878 / gene_product=hypothetical protein / transcript_product=hypothetical protein / location=Cvel_scaffold611:1010-2230(+) / protein_length=407 / sequence_SO=supercontig / SO=protein_coding / is_pseudo=false
MKGGIAFVAHCPEVGENQRVLVVGERPELGGWVLGGALSLRRAPCEHPWWVSDEVKVNLPESPLGASGDGMGMEGEVGRMSMSEVKFRLIAVPDTINRPELLDADSLVCLEPLKGGDFRVVRLLNAPPLPGCSEVGERGDNRIHIGTEGGAEQQRTEMIGMSVEWGVPESVQLGLIPVQTNRETEQHSHREDEHRFPSGHKSERASPTGSHEGIQRDSRMFHSTEEQQSTSEVPICSFQSAADFRGSDSQTGRDAGSNSVRESERGRMQPKEDGMCAPRLNSSGVCSRPFVDTQTDNRKRPSTNAQTDNRVLPSHKPTSTHLPPHECDRGGQKDEGGQRARVISLKRPRSESALPHDDAAECNRIQVGDCAGGRGGYALQGRDGGCVARREAASVECVCFRLCPPYC